MRYSIAALVGLVAVQQAAACDTCWQKPDPFPAGPNNCDECPEQLKGSGGVVDWTQAPSGNPNYLGIKGSDCEVGTGKGKRDFILRGRTFGGNDGGSDISGKCARGKVSQEGGPSFSHQSPLSMKQLNVACSHKTDVQFDFHYDSGPYKGKTCTHTASLTPGDNNVDIGQCGSANRVTCKIPPPPPNAPPPPKDCELGFKTLKFDCRQCPPKTPPKSSAPPPPASSPPVSKPPPGTAPPSSKPPASSPPPPVSSAPPASSAPPQSSSPPSTPPAASSTPPQSSPPETHPPPSSAPPSSAPPVSSPPPETKPPVSSLPPIRNSTTTPPKSETPPYTPPASSAPPASTPVPPPASSSSPPESAPPSETKPNSPQTPPYSTPGSPSSAPPGTTVPVVKTEIIETTVTTCPYTSTHTNGGSVSIETGTTTSTVTRTRTETVCTYCVHPPPQTSAPAPPTQPNSPQQPEQPKAPENPQQPAQPPSPAPAPELLPNCLSTWMPTTDCKGVTDTDCFCKNIDFIKKVQDCAGAWSQKSDELAGAVRYLAGICAKQIPENPGLVVNVPSTITLAPVPAATSPNSPVQPAQPGKTVPANAPANPTPAPAAPAPVQVVKIDTTVTVTTQCPSGAAGGAAPVTQIADGQVQAPAASVCTTTSRISKDVTVPQVAFNTNTAGGVGLVQGPAPVKTGSSSPAQATPAAPAGAKPAGTGAPISPTTPASVANFTGSASTVSHSSSLVLTVVLAAMGLLAFA